MDLDQGYEDNRFENAVSQNFHCPICMCVLKNPVMCVNNQHHFCTRCIMRHLENSRTCPSCRETLRFETLREPLRVVTSCLSELKIRCEYFANGCVGFVRLDTLESHIAVCGYRPVACSNQGCQLTVPIRDQEHHETQVCNFRKVRCDDCVEMRKELDGMNDCLALITGQVCSIRDEIIQEVRDMMTEMKGEIKIIKQAMEGQLSFKPRTREDILVAGGANISSEKSLHSVEIFSWETRTWKLHSPLLQCREGAFSFCYKKQVFVCGGSDGDFGDDSMEALGTSACEEEQWSYFPARLPSICFNSKCVVLDHRLLVIGGYNENEGRISDGIFEVLLDAPFTSKLLARMPEPRSYHGVVIIGDKVVIVGGSTSDDHADSVDSILVYDVHTKKCQQMAPLPFAVSGMAVVACGDYVVLLGGCDVNGVALDTVFMYNIKTEKSTKLPSMKYKRVECCAVVTGNVIVVMGGYDEKQEEINFVECFSFDRYNWKDLPSMIERRCMGTSVVLTNA